MKVKQATLSLIEGSVVGGVSIDQHWRSGLSESGLEAADFRKHFEKTEFQALIAGLPCMWSSKVHWCRDKTDKPWDVFVPFVDAWNRKQQCLFDECDLTSIDESLIAWVPKTSKLGEPPNCTFEPRKPVPLGTMSKDTTEIKTGILRNTDPLMSLSTQDKKESLPTNLITRPCRNCSCTPCACGGNPPSGALLWLCSWILDWRRHLVWQCSLVSFFEVRSRHPR